MLLWWSDHMKSSNRTCSIIKAQNFLIFNELYKKLTFSFSIILFSFSFIFFSFYYFSLMFSPILSSFSLICSFFHNFFLYFFSSSVLSFSFISSFDNSFFFLCLYLILQCNNHCSNQLHIAFPRRPFSAWFVNEKWLIS